ncbi:MAG: hypothetical protein KH405_01995 [Firmicutes bacterium]|nr:hypothetical protein [Bacillota bacterium]
MEHTKANKSRILALILGLTMCLALMLGIAMASPTSTVYAAGETQIDTLGVAFRKVEVGYTLDAAFEFENATTKTLKVPAGANYTATLVSVSKNGQGIKLWDIDEASLPWSRVETQFIEQNVAYCVCVRFKTNDGYKFVKDMPRLRSNMQVLGAELGKGKDIELWDSAGINSIATIVYMKFFITKGMTYIGNIQTVYPEIGKAVSGTIVGFAGADIDTGYCISGAPGPYTYEAKIAPIGTKIKTAEGFNSSTCHYQITAVNSMDYGTMYITATAADGKTTCDIPVRIAAVSGGHEHTWVEKIEKIDFEHHGYTKCTDPACLGVAPAFDKDSQYAVHEFVGGCTEKCTTCGDLGNPNAKHNLKWIAVKPATCSTTGMNAHYKCEGCGKYFDEGKNETTEAALTIPATGDHNYGAWVSNGNGTHTSTCTTCSHSETKNCSGGTATCENKAVCSVCGAEYGEKLGHDWNAWVSNGDGTHTRTCKRDSGHKENGTCSGGKATCTSKAVCDVCRTPYGDTVPHNTTQYGGKDSSGHWDTCSTCDNKFNFEAHTPDREKADETNSVKCTKCDFVITPALGHIHNTTFVDEVGATCMKEGSKSYYKCSGCEVKFEDKEATKPITDESTLVIAKAHKFGAWVDEVPATEEKEGTKGHKDCDFCGKHFDENGTEIADLTIAKLVKAEVTVVGGTGGGRLTVGENATVTAEDKEGKVFKGWKDESGKIVSAEKSYTFKVTGATTLTAVYEDAPAEKEGLSGGAIAGIVIGSVAVAGIGGFAIFWFAVKKKTFADLIAAIKALFTKKK